jgi:hypothetical protein
LVVGVVVKGLLEEARVKVLAVEVFLTGEVDLRLEEDGPATDAGGGGESSITRSSSSSSSSERTACWILGFFSTGGLAARDEEEGRRCAEEVGSMGESEGALRLKKFETEGWLIGGTSVLGALGAMATGRGKEKEERRRKKREEGEAPRHFGLLRRFFLAFDERITQGLYYRLASLRWCELTISKRRIASSVGYRTAHAFPSANPELDCQGRPAYASARDVVGEEVPAVEARQRQSYTATQTSYNSVLFSSP